MLRYVLVCAMTTDDNLVLIRKKRPEWQAGKLNLPGGKINEGETPLQAARREFKEECGAELWGLRRAGILWGDDFEIEVFVGRCEDPSTVTDEEVLTVQWPPRKSRSLWPVELDVADQVIQNLNIIIPLCLSGEHGWNISDVGNESYKVTYVETVEVQRKRRELRGKSRS